MILLSHDSELTVDVSRILCGDASTDESSKLANEVSKAENIEKERFGGTF
jgi:hypothetical protein